MASSLASRMIAAAGKNSRATTLDKSEYFDKDIICQTPVPIVNVMHGGSLKGGLTPGVHTVLGDSRTFKTNFCLLQVAAYLAHDPEAICIFVDCEFGATKYFSQFGIDATRVIHVPVENIEEIKFQVVSMLDELTPQDKVIFFIDSVSQVASKKEVSNALEANEAQDMTRARELNSFWRMVTPMLNLRRIPLWAINSFYTSMGAKGGALDTSVMKGGKQGFLSADTIWFVTRSQEKDSDKNLKGWNFTYNSMKSRTIKERSKFTLTVLYEGGIDKYSGLLDLAREGGFVDMPSSGWYVRTKFVNGFETVEDKKWRLNDMSCAEFWDPVLATPAFDEYLKKCFVMEGTAMIQGDEEIDPETGEITREAEGAEGESSSDAMKRKLRRAQRKAAEQAAAAEQQ